MYSLKQVEDTIRIPAEYIEKGKSLSEHVDRLAHDAFEGRFDDDGNYILLTFNHELEGRGRIIHGDGAIYQKVRFKALLFSMEQNEVVDGAVSEVHEFGAFVRIGPMEALLHKSQILDEQIDINIGLRRIEGRQSGKHLAEGTPVRARIVSLSLNPHDPRSSKIGLTCKQPSLGAHDWLDGDKED
ncbi:MAG: DNA-directed RNA polymerase [Candidatus Thalassarchaeaceae archaeon]|jgi:DNA-directed RNA polymerase subunit E'|nr:DNA-directed RNA polymerase [Candidatus Thalassarchaeaceae archaeon]